VVADPGAPSDIARALVERKLSRLLACRVSRRVGWEVQLVQEALPLDEHRTLPLLEVAAERKPDAGWDMLVYLTDLPRSAGSEPVVAELSAKDGTALISLPAIGGVLLRRHVRETLLYLVGRMYQARYGDHDSGEPDGPEDSDAGAVAASRSGRLLRRPSERVSPLREKPSAQEGTDTMLVLTGVRGRARLLFGMVRNNRPWRLVPHLATATAAADLLCIDELGYMELDRRGAELLFQVLTEREEKNSVAIASNESFGGWTKTFTDPRLCAAIVDRLTFNGTIIQTGTDSYRLAHTKAQTQQAVAG